MPDSKPTILIFHRDEVDNHLLQIVEEVNVFPASFDEPDAPSALLKEHPSARAIWIIDSDITTPEFKDLTEQVVEYVRNGGIAIMGGRFVYDRFDNFDDWMKNAWNMPWRYGQYVTAMVVFQSTAVGPHQYWRDGLAAAYTQKGGLLSGVAPSDSWYASLPDAISESFVFGPVPVASQQTSTAFGRFGEGWLGWTGDIYHEDETVAALHAMMGFNEREAISWRDMFLASHGMI